MEPRPSVEGQSAAASGTSVATIVDTALKIGVGIACLYEAIAIGFSQAGSDAVPTISREVGIYPWIGPIVLVGLAIHFYWTPIKNLLSKSNGGK